MPDKLLWMKERLNTLAEHKRTVVYTIILFLVVIGQYFTMQMPLELFRYTRQSVMSMLCLLGFCGAFVLMCRKKGGRADTLFAFLMFLNGLTNLISLVRGVTTGYAGVVEYRYLSLSMLIYGSTYAYFYLLYPIEAFRPGWLTLKRALILYLPTLGTLGLYLLATRIFRVTVPVIDDWSDLTREFWNVTVWLRLLVLFYPMFGLAIMLRYRNHYREWCENNFASMKDIDSKWLGDYIFANFVIIYSSLVIVFSNNPRSVLVHNIIFLLFFLYGFHRVYSRKNPYPEGYFRASMNETKAVVSETSEQDHKYQSHFARRLPEYREKLELWMETEKPHLRKDFKLTDAMEILPLNRSYLSRLFNEGYGERFYQFVMRYRIEESKQLLLSRPDLTISTIAGMSGFSSPSVFGRAFTQEVKCTPMQWRDRETTDN